MWGVNKMEDGLAINPASQDGLLGFRQSCRALPMSDWAQSIQAHSTDRIAAEVLP